VIPPCKQDDHDRDRELVKEQLDSLAYLRCDRDKSYFFSASGKASPSQSYGGRTAPTEAGDPIGAIASGTSSSPSRAEIAHTKAGASPFAERIRRRASRINVDLRSTSMYLGDEAVRQSSARARFLARGPRDPESADLVGFPFGEER